MTHPHPFSVSLEGRLGRLRFLGRHLHPAAEVIRRLHADAPGTPLPLIGSNEEEVCLTYYTNLHGIEGGVHIDNDGQYGLYLKGPKSVTEHLESIIESALGLSGNAGAKQ